MINFGSGFISQKSRDSFDARRKHLEELARAKKLEWPDPELKKAAEQYDAEHPKDYATVDDVADHVMHVVKLVGIDHVGLGSDFDGVGDSLPRGLENVSKYPRLLDVLSERGLSSEDLEKLCGENLLRVWKAVEEYAAAHK